MINIGSYQKLPQGVKIAICAMLRNERRLMISKDCQIASGRVAKKMHSLGISNSTNLTLSDINEILSV